MAFYAFYSYLNSNFEPAPGYLNPALLIGLPGIRVGQYLFSDLVLKNDVGQFTQWWGVGGWWKGGYSTKFNTERFRPEVQLLYLFRIPPIGKWYPFSHS